MNRLLQFIGSLLYIYVIAVISPLLIAVYIGMAALVLMGHLFKIIRIIEYNTLKGLKSIYHFPIKKLLQGKTILKRIHFVNLHSHRTH